MTGVQNASMITGRRRWNDEQVDRGKSDGDYKITIADMDELQVYVRRDLLQ